MTATSLPAQLAALREMVRFRSDADARIMGLLIDLAEVASRNTSHNAACLACAEAFAALARGLPEVE